MLLCTTASSQLPYAHGWCGFSPPKYGLQTNIYDHLCRLHPLQNSMCCKSKSKMNPLKEVCQNNM
eukprot:8205396-Karenia_brevis.AAC.1